MHVRSSRGITAALHSGAKDMMTITADDRPLIQEWLNCETASVDAEGDVWVEGPMVGHWLSAERRQAFIDWRQTR